MRWHLAVLAALGWATASAPAAEFPYTAVVKSDDVYVRSGPGKSYYPTDKLRTGDRVEVYRHDPGGWLAIRPPAGSFSWVSVRHLEKTEADLGKVTEEGVVARVGSLLSDHRDVIQVRLRRGEAVELREVPGKKNPQWHTIAPPAGEFRWVFAKFVEPETGSAAARPVRRTGFNEPTADGEPREPELLDPRAERSARRSTGPSPPDDEAMAAGGEEVFAPADQWRTPDRPARVARAAWQTKATASEARRRWPEPGDELSVRGGQRPTELEAIDSDLSRIVADDVSRWRLAPLRARCEILLARAETPLDRGRARLLLRRIERFEQLQGRYDRRSAPMVSESRWANGAAATANVAPARAPELAPAAAGFDGTGRLEAVVSRRLGAPQFALFDTFGVVQAYLVAAPGVNLRLYQGKQVGVTGTRAFLLDEQKPLITVQRVSPLDAAAARQASRPYSFPQIQ